MLVCLDSSALVKLVVEEAGSDVVARLWDDADAVVASRLAVPEVRAALEAASALGLSEAHPVLAAFDARLRAAPLAVGLRFAPAAIS